MKVGIIGLGMVGKEILLNLFNFSVATEIWVLDLNKEKSMAEIMDLEDTIALGHYNHSKSIHWAKDYSSFKGCNVLILNVSIPRKGTTETADRLALLKENQTLIASIAKEIGNYCPESKVIITSNPVDLMAKAFLEYSGMRPNQVIGTGTALDTARLSLYIAKYFNIGNYNIVSWVLGEHGDSSFGVWSLAKIAGIPLDDFAKIRHLPPIDKEIAIQYVRDRGLDIFKARGYTDHGIGASVYTIFEAITGNEQRIIPVSAPLTKEYGFKDITIGVPCIIGGNGIESILEIPLNNQEKENFSKSVHILTHALKNIQ